MKLSQLRIATRGSELALWQANFVRAELERIHPSLQVELLIIKTKGDKILDVPLAKIGGKGLFVKELETAMLENKADIAVHSMKDVPMAFPTGLNLAIICEREDPTDAFVSNNFSNFNELPQGACVGTSSLRRQCHIKALRPDLQIEMLRGNVNTRLQRLDEKRFDAIILASAGLKRLGKADRIRQSLTVEQSLPAVGQGAVGIECRTSDTATRKILQSLQHKQTTICVTAERAMNRKLNGGCQVPIAGFAIIETDNTLFLRGIVASPDTGIVLSAQMRGSQQDATAIGEAVAEQLLAQGAQTILDDVYKANESG